MNPRVKKICELRTAGNSSILSVFTASVKCTVATCCVMYNNLLTFTQLILAIKTVRDKVIYLAYSLLHAYVRICTAAIKYLFTVYKDHAVVMLLVVPQSVTEYPT